jgi:hypothetical protein
MARVATAKTGCGLVQVVRVRWTKAARGGDGARARNAVPAAFEVPALAPASTEGLLCVDTFHWDERNGFAEPLSTDRHQVPLVDGFSFGCVGVVADAEGLVVRYQYNRGNSGAPDQWFFNSESGYGESPGRTLLVRGREWARVCYNGRFSCLETGNWWYQQVTVNVAWFAGAADGRLFLDREPTQELRALAELW